MQLDGALWEGPDGPAVKWIRARFARIDRSAEQPRLRGSRAKAMTSGNPAGLCLDGYASRPARIRPFSGHVAMALARNHPVESVWLSARIRFHSKDWGDEREYARRLATRGLAVYF